MNLFMQILSTIKSQFGGDLEKKLGDFLLDKLEEFVQQTDNTIDDKMVLPVIKGLRIIYDIPDGEE